MSRSVLLVEDDEYKASDIIKTLYSVSQAVKLQRAASATSALRAVALGKFDLVLLDMSLPTFDISGPGGGGSPEGQGGVEVIRVARRLKNSSPFVVVTQYPDIEINGREIPLHLAAQALTTTFGVQVLACIMYDFDGDVWREPLRRVIEGAIT